MTPENKFVELRNDRGITEVSKTTFNDSLYEGCISSCDLIIKTGPELFQSYCHKIILASSSKFIWDLLETTQAGTTPVS